ncbi:3-phosphoshikimate 1-carboxyvinyltransferase, partial [uncultured Veillonella sp.]
MHSVTNAIPTGTIASIPAKAHAHRALICAALANSPSTILLSRTSKDIDATMDSLRGLGAHVVYENKVVTVTPGPVPTKGNVVPHESGTTLRLLLPVAASICNDVDVDAKGRLPDRPLEPMLSEMKAHGVTFSQDKPPFTMTGRLQGGNFSMVGDVSSQFFSGLLLAAPQIGLSTITATTPLQSSDYVTLTTETMRDFGVEVEHTLPDTNINEAFTVPFGASFIGRDNYQIEGDWSNAAIWMVA